MAQAPMYIVNPLEAGTRSLSALTSTHPPIQERVRILRSMGGGASYFAYAAAASKVGGKSAVHIPATALAAEKAANLSTQPARAGAAALTAQAADSPGAAGEARQPEPTARQRSLEAGDLVRRMHDFRFVTCSCGLKMKIPPDYTKPQVKCPRCSKIHSLA